MTAKRDATPAHDQGMTIHLVMHVPEHLPREGDPHYAAFHAAKARIKKLGLNVCIIAGCTFPGPMELHHSHLEFSLAAGCDLDKVNSTYGLHLANDEEFQVWIESPGNLEVLCLHGATPVLMASGDWRPIEDIAVGDMVIGGDARPHQVTGVAVKPHDGAMIEVGRAALTPEHLVATSAGWMPAGLCGYGRGLGVFRLEMSRMAFVQDQVLNPVVGSVAVDVVDSFGTQKRATDVLLHDHTVLHRETTVIDNSDIAGSRRSMLHLLGTTLTGDGVESGHTTPARAEGSATTDLAATYPELSTALAAGEVVPDDALWSRSRVVRHTGSVYDIEVAGCHSFVADGMIVHNCPIHHRTRLGVHVIPGPEWEPLRVWKAAVVPPAEFIPASELKKQ